MVLQPLQPRISSREASISYLTGTDTSNATREITYTATPRATQNYTGDAATTLAADITKTAKTFAVADGSTLTAETYINIEGEQMFLKSISGNNITVRRGEDKTAKITDSPWWNRDSRNHCC